jgi:hypothetical protein
VQDLDNRTTKLDKAHGNYMKTQESESTDGKWIKRWQRKVRRLNE